MSTNGIGKHFIITGIPRSGGGLLCNLLNQLDNVVCFNEVIYNVAAIPGAFSTLRTMLLMHEPVPNKSGADGSGAQVSWEPVEKQIDEHVTIGLKANVPYLARLTQVMSHGCRVVAMVRNPVDTLADWNAACPGSFNELDVRFSSRYGGFPFKSRDMATCQAEVWNHWAEVIWENQNHLLTVRYENLINETAKTIYDIAKWLELNYPMDGIVDLRDVRARERSLVNPEIALAVSQYAPIASSGFGYKLN